LDLQILINYIILLSFAGLNQGSDAGLFLGSDLQEILRSYNARKLYCLSRTAK